MISPGQCFPFYQSCSFDQVVIVHCCVIRGLDKISNPKEVRPNDDQEISSAFISIQNKNTLPVNMDIYQSTNVGFQNQKEEDNFMDSVAAFNQFHHKYRLDI